MVIPSNHMLPTIAKKVGTVLKMYTAVTLIITSHLRFHISIALCPNIDGNESEINFHHGI